MKVHVEFRGLAVDPSLEAIVRERLEGLGTTFKDLFGCHVVIEVPHRHRKSGNHYHVRIELSVPGDTLIVSNQPDVDRTVLESDTALSKSKELSADHRQAAIAVRQAFDVARRRLREFVERLHDKPPVRA